MLDMILAVIQGTLLWLLGGGNMNNRNVGSIFQSARSGGVPIGSSDVREELRIVNFEKLLDEARENAKLRESELSQHQESKLEVAKNSLKSGVDHEVNQQFEKVNDGRGEQHISNINGDEDSQSLASPRGDIRGGSRKEVSGERAQSGKFVLSLVRAIEGRRIKGAEGSATR